MTMGGEGNGKSSKSAGLAFNPDLTAVILDNAVANGQAESGPFADVLCRKEWIKYLAEMFRGNAAAIVLEFDAEPIIVGAVSIAIVNR